MTSEKDNEFPLAEDLPLTLKKAQWLVESYRKRLADGNGYSGLYLIMLTQHSCMLSDEIYRELGMDRQKWEGYCLETFDVLHQNAENGNFFAMQGLAFFYQNGYPPNDDPDYDKMKEWCRKAWDLGYRGQC